MKKEFKLDEKEESHATRIYATEWYHKADIKEFIKIYSERLRKLGVKDGDVPEIIGVELAIYEFKR